MKIVILTVFVSILLVGFFLFIFFVYQNKENRFSSSEREALMPLEKDDTAKNLPSNEP